MDDLYWCHEGCGFVKKDHRCEQWCCVSMIPGKAVEKLQAERDSWQAKAIQHSFDLGVAKRENDALRASLRDMTEYAEEYASNEDTKWGTYRSDARAIIRSDIAKARGLLK